MDVNHTSNTAFQADNYNTDKVCKSQPEGWVKFIQGHPCYDPSKVRVSRPGPPHARTRRAGLWLAFRSASSKRQRCAPPVLARHRCTYVAFCPPQDLVIPAHRTTSHYHDSPLMGKPPKTRDLLLFFRVRTPRPPNNNRKPRHKTLRVGAARRRRWHPGTVSEGVQSCQSRLLPSGHPGRGRV